MSELTIFHATEVGDWESNLFSFAQFLGVSARHVRCPASGDDAAGLPTGSGVVAMSADSLAALEDRNLLSGGVFGNLAEGGFPAWNRRSRGASGP